MTPLIQPPLGSIPIPSATVSASWVLMHPDNANVPHGDRGLTNTHEPLAYIHLGTVQAAMDELGNVWIPTLNDLTPAGRMVRDMLVDNAVIAGGKEQILHNLQSSVPGVMGSIAHALVN